MVTILEEVPRPESGRVGEVNHKTSQSYILQLASWIHMLFLEMDYKIKLIQCTNYCSDHGVSNGLPQFHELEQVNLISAILHNY